MATDIVEAVVVATDIVEAVVVATDIVEAAVFVAEYRFRGVFPYLLFWQRFRYRAVAF